MADDKELTDAKELTDVIEEAVHKGATTVEEIHRQIAEMPLKVLEQLGVVEKSASDVREIQETSIGAVYDLIRNVNNEVAQLARDILESQKKGKKAGGE